MSCDIVFVCQAGELAQQSVLLAKSIRLFGGKIATASLHAIIPIPEDVYGSVRREILEFLVGLGAKLYYFRNPIDDAYKYGNKLNAFNIDYTTDDIVFLDTDMVVFDDFSGILENKTASILAVPNPLHWFSENKLGGKVWKELYAQFNLPLPQRKILARETKKEMWPYFDSSMIICSSRANFSQYWIRVGKALHPQDIPGKNPYLDQISLSVAISLAGLSWDTLSDEYNFDLALWFLKRRLRWIPGRADWFKLLPTFSHIKIFHYRGYRILQQAAKQDPGFRVKFNRLLDEIPLSREIYAVPARRSLARRLSNFWDFQKQ